MERMLLEEAVQFYNDLVSRDEESAHQIHTAMMAEMKESKVSYGGRSVCNYLRPKFVTQGQLSLIKSVNLLIRSAILRLKDAMFRRADVLEQVGLTAAESRLVGIDPGYKKLSVTSRLDSFLTPDSLKFVELNGEAPAGIAYTDRMASLMMKIPLMREFGKKYIVYRFATSGILLGALLDCYYNFLRNSEVKKKLSSVPQIAIVDWRDVPTWMEFELFQEFFESQGFNAIICDPRELEYTNGRLHYKGFKIDLLYRRVLVTEFLEKEDELRAMLQAYKDRAVCVINSFRAKLLHKKSIFALLTDERYQRLFSDEERFTIHNYIPWTRRIEERKTIFGGQPIDLIPFIYKYKNSLVIKPNDDYGGRGVLLGWNATDKEWEKIIKTALDGDYYVVQERVPIPHEPFPEFVDGKLKFSDLIVDFDPYIFGKNVGGILTRLSGTGLSNVTAGGSSVPTFVIEDR